MVFDFVQALTTSHLDQLQTTEALDFEFFQTREEEVTNPVGPKQ